MNLDSDDKLTVRVVAGLLENEEGEVLITQRQPKSFMPLKWEFPGGKVEPGENDSQALARELKEELGIDVEVGEHFMGVLHAYPDFNIDFHVYRCELLNGEIQALAVHDFRWVDVDELDSYDFPPADQPTIEQLLK
jgi:8-oxo-dGTP diphosphatase